MKSAALSLAVALSLFAIPCLAAGNAAADPAQTVQAFYAYHFKHDMGFGAPEVKARKAWLAPKLYELLIKVLNKPVPKGDAPDIEGDVFTDSQDTPTSFKVGKAAVEKDTAKVDVTFVWSGEKRHVTVILAQIDKEWRIVDIDYGAHRSLTKELQDAAH
ncbi:MAG TPA: DUF3828 domain-containing protein [Chthoniobacteraceae bacterium]|nr:DUF3828 domain-containing protein [Chthoniobacteraceae bacterium]